MSAELVDRVHSRPQFLRIVTTFDWAALVLWLVVQAAAGHPAAGEQTRRARAACN